MNRDGKTLLSPRQLAEAIGVSESSIKRWADDGSVVALRTAGGHRRIPIEEAVSFIRVSGSRVVRPAILGLAEFEDGPVDAAVQGSESRVLFNWLRDGRTDDARGLIVSLYLSGWSTAQLIDGPIRDAMQWLGESWESRPEAVLLEHQATDFVIQALNQVRSLLHIPSVAAPRAIGAAPSGDPYILPTLAACTVLTELGFRATNLGPETPMSTLHRAASELAPDLMWISVSTKSGRDRVREDLSSLVEALSLTGASLAIGGRQATTLASAHRSEVFIGSSMAELETFARRRLVRPRFLAERPSAMSEA